MLYAMNKYTDDELRERINRQKKIISEDKFALSNINDPYNISIVFENCINSCKSLLFKRVSMPQHERLSLQKTNTIQRDKITELQLVLGQILVSQITTLTCEGCAAAKNLIAYHNQLYLIKCLVTVNKCIVPDSPDAIKRHETEQTKLHVGYEIQFVHDRSGEVGYVCITTKITRSFQYDLIRKRIAVEDTKEQYVISSDNDAQYLQQVIETFISGWVISNDIVYKFQTSKIFRNLGLCIVELTDLISTINETEYMFQCADDPKTWLRLYNRDNWQGYSGKIDGLDEDTFIMQSFILECNIQQSVWLELRQMSDIAPRYKKILMRREIEQNGYVNFTSQNTIDLHGQDHKISRLDFKILPTEPLYTTGPIVEDKIYDKDLMSQIIAGSPQHRDAIRNVFYPLSIAKRSQIHFVMENSY